MTRLSRAWLAAVMVPFFCHTAPARTIDSPYQVGTWPGFRTAALSYTFDDNCSNQLAVAVPLFNQYSLKVTLFTVTSWVTSWTGLKNAAAQGHEIASHTVTHVSLGGLSNATQDNELKNSRDAINTNITNQKCVTMAYPNCVEASDAITSSYYFAARGCSGAIEPKTPVKFMNISSFVCGSTGSYTTAQSLNGLANQAINSGGWCILLIHGIDNDGGYSPIASAVLSSHVHFVDSLKSVLWVSTFGNVARYVRERDSVSVKELSSNANSVTLQVTDNLDSSIFNYSVTVRRPLPAGWTQISVTQKGQRLNSSIAGQNVMFDVVPNRGDIVLSSSVTSVAAGSRQTSSPAPQGFHARVVENSVNFSLPITCSGTMSVELFDARGTKIAALTSRADESGFLTCAFPKELFNSGIVVVRLIELRTRMSQNNATEECFLFSKIR